MNRNSVSAGASPAVDPWLLEVFDRAPVTAEGAPLLRVENLSVRFGGISALSGVSFDVQPHDIVAIIGPNGAGKSTLLNSISGLNRDNAEGSVQFAGAPTLGLSPARVAALGVGRSFQDPPLIDRESVLENIMLGAHLRLGYRMFDQIFVTTKVRRLEAEARGRASSILEFAGLADVAHKPVGGLAYGVRKLVDIARALMSGPHLLLLDEPTSGLDADEQQAVARLLAELHRITPVTILVVEHHMDVVRALANQVVGLHSGSVLIQGTPTEVLDSAVFRAAVVGGQADAEATPAPIPDVERSEQ